MKFYAIEKPSYQEGEYPIFLGVENNDVVVSKSDKYNAFKEDGNSITFYSKTGEVSDVFLNGATSDGKTIRKVEDVDPNLKFLLYFIWIGLSDMTMLIQSISSYIKVGGFVGDVIVISDQQKPEALNQFPQVKFVYFNAAERFNKKKVSINNIYSIKTFIIDCVDITKYDWMVYSDSDILCVTPHLMQLFQAMNDKSFVWYSKDIGCVAYHRPCCGLGILTEDEMVNFRSFSVNAGWFFLPCNSLGLEFLSKFRALSQKYDFEMDDQGCLYAVMIRETFPRRLALGIKGFFDGGSFSPPHCESQLIHFYSAQRNDFAPKAKELGL